MGRGAGQRSGGLGQNPGQSVGSRSWTPASTPPTPTWRARWSSATTPSTKASCADDNGHGTHVAGTIAAAVDLKGVAGVAPGASLVAVKVLDGDGSSSLTSVIKGIIWCGNHNIQVANMSLGAPTGFIFLRAAVMYAKAKGVVLVAAAGNSGKAVEYPAGYPDVIAVSAGDPKDRIADFSSRGTKVEFIAPGTDILSTVPGGRWEAWDGTSMATPMSPA